MVAGDHNVSVAAADLRISSKVPAIMPVLSIIAASIVYEIDGSLRDPDGEFAASPEQTGLDLAEERLRILKAYADGHFTDDPKVIAHATRIHSRAEPRVYEGREASKSAARAS
ncbi:hypothetical protein [Leifsonia sp. Leaf264]|uniref:hypothetical protein n=1 Tax=Leifsonia sp. Leaf264 TaxID=1736314 RepID=UPI0012FCCBE0|nr:hypothetical protein [Leifsonia sp. Leaf264]